VITIIKFQQPNGLNTMNQQELDLIVVEHGKWLLDSTKGSIADLYNADDKKWVCDGNYHQLTNIGSKKGVLELYSCGDLGWLIRRGCFTGSKQEFIDKVKETHKNNEHAVKYLALIDALCV